MTVSYDTEKSSVYDDIKDAGCAVSLAISATLGTYNPVTETYARGVITTTQNTYAVIKEYSEKYIDGKMIRTGDKEFLIPSYISSKVDLVISQEHKITKGAILWNIVNIKSIAPSDDPILYKVQARR